MGLINEIYAYDPAATIIDKIDKHMLENRWKKPTALELVFRLHHGDRDFFDSCMRRLPRRVHGGVKLVMEAYFNHEYIAGKWQMLIININKVDSDSDRAKAKRAFLSWRGARLDAGKRKSL